MSDVEEKQYSRAELIELFRQIHDLGGCDASDSYFEGWDAAVAACEDIVTDLFGIDYDDLDEDTPSVMEEGAVHV